MSNYHVGCLLYINELHRVPAQVWLGKRREYVHRAPILFLYTYTTYVGLCERDTNLERDGVCVRECFWFGGCDLVNVFMGICVDDISNKILHECV